MENVLNVSMPEAARRLGVCLRTVGNLIQSKELASRRIGRRRVVPVAELEKFIRRDHSTAPIGDNAEEDDGAEE